MRLGFRFWLFVAVIGGVFVSRLMTEHPQPAGSAASPSDAGDGRAPPPALGAYALDTTRSSWPPIDPAVAEAPAPNPFAVNYYIVLDGSGSMLKSQCSGGRRKIEAAVAALDGFVRHVRPEHNLGLAVFDGQGLSERVALAEGNGPQITAALAQVVASGATPLRSAIGLGFDRLTRQARRQLGYGEYHLVVVTDGHPDPADEDPTPIVDTLLKESPVLLHTVGFCIGTDHVLNQQGRVFYAAADSPEQLRSGLEAVLAEAPSFDVSRFNQ